MKDDQEKNRAVMWISLASRTDAEMMWVNSSGVNKSPVKTNSPARLDVFANLTTGKKKRIGKSPKRAFGKMHT